MIKNYIYIDLTKVYNTQLVNTKNNKICFLSESFPEFGKVVDLGNASYILNRNIDLYDCFYCDEQKIKINNVKAKKIFILANMDWGSMEESIDVVFIDSSKVKYKFYLLDSGDCKPRFDCDKQLENARIAFLSDTVYSNKAAIYEVELNIENIKPIDFIVMPYNINLCIFAITFME